jgi:hypothetical protein
VKRRGCDHAEYLDFDGMGLEGVFRCRGGGAAGGPMEYSVETVEHNKSAEVNVEALSKLLKKKSADGWTLISVVDDDGGKLISSMGGSSEAQSLGSLGSGTFNSKEDRLVLIFGRPMK